MERHNCRVHGHYSGDSGCPDCQTAREREEDSRQEMLEKLEKFSDRASEAAERAAFRTNNPGDYECPACRMISLKYYASRCPLCQSDVPDAYWVRVCEREREANERRRKAEILVREAEARQRERERIAEEERKQAHEKRLKWLASPEYARARREQIGKGCAFAALCSLVLPFAAAFADPKESGDVLVCYLARGAAFWSVVLGHMALFNLRGTDLVKHRYIAICALVLGYVSVVSGLIWYLTHH